MNVPSATASPLSRLVVCAFLAAAGLAGSPAAAQVDTSDWECKFCPFPEGHDAEVTAGAGYVSDDSARIGSASGLDEEGAYAAVDGSGRYADEGYQLAWSADDLGLDSRSVEVAGGRQGRFGVALEYSELPYRLFKDARTVFTPSGADTLVLPANWVAAGQTSGMTALAGSLRPAPIESDRSLLSVGANLLTDVGVSFDVEYRRQERDGVDIVSVSNFVQAALLPRQIDYRTDLIDAALNWSRGPLNVDLRWFGSYFKNSSTALIWGNPFLTFPGAEQGRMALEPDNEFQSLSLSGSMRLPAFDSMLRFSATVGQGEQNDMLLPYTINPTLTTGSLPRTAFDGDVDTTNYALTFIARPLPRARLKFTYRHDERDNNSMRDTWSRVVVDSFPAIDTDVNTPFSFERRRVALRGEYRVFDDLRIAGAWERVESDRDFQEVAEQTEDEGWGQAQWRPLEWLDVDVKGGTSRRDIDRYDENLAIQLGQNPLMRKYHLAYRYRRFAELNVGISPGNLPLWLNLASRYSDDSYTKSRLGMLEGEELHLSADAGWAISDKTSVYVLAAHDGVESVQAGSSQFAAPNWRAAHDDDVRTIGLGMQVRDIRDNLDVNIDYSRTQSETAIRVLSTTRGAGDLPTLTSDFDDFRLTLAYRRSASFAIAAELRWQRLDSDDWALAGIAPETIPVVLSLGAQPYDEDVLIVTLGVRYRPGADK